MTPINYTRDQLKDLCHYIDGEEYLGDRNRSFDELMAASILYDCDYCIEELVDTFVLRDLDLMDFGNQSMSDISEEDVKSFLKYYLVKALNLDIYELPLYINSKVFLVRTVVLWRIGRGYAC